MFKAIHKSNPDEEKDPFLIERHSRLSSLSFSWMLAMHAHFIPLLLHPSLVLAARFLFPFHVQFSSSWFPNRIQLLSKWMFIKNQKKICFSFRLAIRLWFPFLPRSHPVLAICLVSRPEPAALAQQTRNNRIIHHTRTVQCMRIVAGSSKDARFNTCHHIRTISVCVVCWCLLVSFPIHHPIYTWDEPVRHRICVHSTNDSRLWLILWHIRTQIQRVATSCRDFRCRANLND